MKTRKEKKPKNMTNISGIIPKDAAGLKGHPRDVSLKYGLPQNPNLGDFYLLDFSHSWPPPTHTDRHTHRRTNTQRQRQKHTGICMQTHGHKHTCTYTLGHRVTAHLKCF